MKRRSQAVSFEGERIRFSRGGTVTGFHADLQMLLVLLNTVRGSDPLYRTKGTDLRKAAVSGRIQDQITAGHAVNFAVLDAINFLRTTRTGDDLNDPDRLVRVTAVPVDFTNRRMRIEIRTFDGNGTPATVTHTSPIA